MAVNDGEGRDLLGYGQSKKTKAIKATDKATSPFHNGPDSLFFKTLKVCIPRDLTEIFRSSEDEQDVQ